MSTKSEVLRARLIDEPIVEHILSEKFFKSGIKFMHADKQSDFEGTDIICMVNGTKKSINVKRNSSQYWNSPNFTLPVDKNNLSCFNNSTMVFIDEVANSLYVVDSFYILSYIIQHYDNLRVSKNPKKHYIIIPKQAIVEMISDVPNSIIKYDNVIAERLAEGRDESKFTQGRN